MMRDHQPFVADPFEQIGGDGEKYGTYHKINRSTFDPSYRRIRSGFVP